LARPEFVRFVPEPDVRHGIAAARSLLSLAVRPSAIVAFNDKIAVGVMRAAGEMGLTVPGDLSVIGFDSLELSRLVQPPLTTVRQPIDEMARMGVELLMRLVNKREIEALHVELAAELIIGGSTAPPS
jgi:LacI family transcriptional regulator